MSVTDIDKGWNKIAASMKKGGVVASFAVSADQLEKMIWNEFGTATAPERSFIRSTIEDHRVEYLTFLTLAALAIMDGAPPEAILKEFGEVVINDIKAKIDSIIAPENANSTLRGKTGTTPLRDTDEMYNSLVVTVEGKLNA